MSPIFRLIGLVSSECSWRDIQIDFQNLLKTYKYRIFIRNLRSVTTRVWVSSLLTYLYSFSIVKFNNFYSSAFDFKTNLKLLFYLFYYFGQFEKFRFSKHRWNSLWKYSSFWGAIRLIVRTCCYSFWIEKNIQEKAMKSMRILAFFGYLDSQFDDYRSAQKWSRIIFNIFLNILLIPSVSSISFLI